MLRVYMDESGTHAGSPVVTVAAYTATPKTWKVFTREWNVAKRPISVFHSTDCEALQGEFKGWTTERRDEFVARLLPVLAKREMFGDAIGINIKDFDDAVRMRNAAGAIFGSAYQVCLQVVVDNIIWQMEKTGMNDALAFIHEDNDYKEAALAAFDWVKRGRKKHASNMTLTFAPKDRAVPLQAADVLAYEANKRLRNQDRPKRRSLVAMDPSDEKLNIAGIDKRNAKQIVQRLEIARQEMALLGHSVTWLRGS